MSSTNFETNLNNPFALNTQNHKSSESTQHKTIATADNETFPACSKGENTRKLKKANCNIGEDRPKAYYAYSRYQVGTRDT